ncbi:MAG TPA: hypothetical protein HPP97_00915 [Desulfuromonadales bacterium]|nr:hypothetical protein [Desulfuromonadales bacterium]
MIVIKIVMSTLFIVSYSSISWADSIVFSFSDGKKQTVILDSPLKSISSVQYLPSINENPAVPQAESVGLPPQRETKQPLQQKEPAKPIVRFKWAEPIAGQ